MKKRLELNEQELHIQALLTEAIGRYGCDHVDMELVESEDSSDIQLSIYYHSSQNSFGIFDNLPLSQVRLQALHQLEDDFNIWLDTDEVDLPEDGLFVSAHCA